MTSMSPEVPEKRHPVRRVRVSSYDGRGGISSYNIPHEEVSVADPFKLNDGTGLYTIRSIIEFVRYEIDGAFQTDVNEFMVHPFCLVAMSVDQIPRYRQESPEKAVEVLRLVGAELARLTRKADRSSRIGVNFVSLLRRTGTKKVKEYYVPRVSGHVQEVSEKAGTPVTLSYGVVDFASGIKNMDDMFRKASRALFEAEKSGPGSVVVYDPRTMPLQSSVE